MPNRTILLVDDQIATRKLVRLALERAHFVVLEARDGETALALMREHAPTIVIQDLVLPDIDGFTLAARLRALAGEVPLRLLAFSGLVPYLDAERMASTGFDDVIAKSIAPSRLVELVEAHWGGIEPSSFVAATPSDELEREHARRAARQLERQREAEQQERLACEQAAVWRALVDHAPDVVMHLDTNGRVRFINRVPPGLPADRVHDASWFDLNDSAYHEEMQAALSAVVSQGVGRTVETSWRVADGTVHWSEMHLGPVRIGGEIGGALVIQRDVTHKKQTEAQLIIADRMASVGALAAGVAHEINNPLASVMANLDLALHEAQTLLPSGPSELIDELRDAREAAERVRRIVRDLRIFSRSDEDTREPVDVERVLDSALRMARNEIRQRARVLKEYEQVPPVAANEARLGQVFLNLIINAAQAIEEGAAERNQIRVRLGRDAAGSVVVSVSDSGAGMTAALRSRLFTPFVTTKPPGVGTGLGLSICHRIVTGLGGFISVESELGQGTEFRVTLPACVEPINNVALLPVGVRSSARRGRVLVIDDEPMITQVVRRTLTREHDVFTLDNAAEAYRLVELGQRFDVILCDLLMPQMSGMDFHRVLARAYPEQAERMVFFTGGAFTPRAIEFLERVPNHRMEKPIDGQELRALINGLVR